MSSSQPSRRSLSISQLQSQYFSLYPPRSISFPPLSCLQLADNQGALHDSLLDHPVLRGFPPARDYQLKFWKIVIEHLEEELKQEKAVEMELELDERLLEHYFQLMTITKARSSAGPQTSYKTYIYQPSCGSKRRRISPYHESPSREPLSTDLAAPDGGENDQRMITLVEAQTTIEAGSTGLRTWTASLYLASRLLEDPTLIQRNRTCTDETSQPSVLELGSGTGFLSMFLSQIGCPTVWASDIGDEVDGTDKDADADGMAASRDRRRGPLETLKSNLQINLERLPHPVIPVQLDWFDAMDKDVSSRHTKLDELAVQLSRELVIVAADVIYDPELVPALVACLAYFLGKEPDERFALIAATVRNESTIEAFARTCEEEGLGIQRVTTAVDADDSEAPADPMFWNANAWEGQEVLIMRVELRKAK